jgi:hypothetical protein
MHMAKTYLIDVMVRGQPDGVETGEEPIIAATRVAVQVPELMGTPQIGRAIGEEVRKVGLSFLDNAEQLSVSIDRYEEAMEEEAPDFTDLPPEFRPN